MSRLRHLLLAGIASLVVFGLAACGGGGGGGGDEDPQAVLDETFAPGKDYSKGVVDVSLKFAAEGDEGGSLDASLKGPFQSEEGAFPQFDISADVSLGGAGPNVDFQGGLVSAGDAAFVGFQGTDYKVDDPTFNNFKQLYLSLQSQNQGQGQSTLDPSGFLVDLKNDGEEDVDGTETIHISGRADIDKLVGQVQSAPGAAEVGAAQLDQLKGAVKEADFDVFSGAEDKRLRKIDARIVFEPPPDQAGAGNSTITAEFSLAFSALGEPQTISAPASSKPLSVLLEQYGLDGQGLGQALGAGAASPQSGAGATSTTPGAAATPAPPTDDQANQYLDCLSKAKGQAATQACAELIQ